MRLDRNSNYINRNTNYNPQFKRILPIFVEGSKSYETTEKVIEHFQEIIDKKWKPGSLLANLKSDFIMHLKKVTDPTFAQIQTRIINNIDTKETIPGLGYLATDDTAIAIKLGVKNNPNYESQVVNNIRNRAKFISDNPKTQTPYMGMYIHFNEVTNGKGKGINITGTSFKPIPDIAFKDETCLLRKNN